MNHQNLISHLRDLQIDVGAGLFNTAQSKIQELIAHIGESEMTPDESPDPALPQVHSVSGTWSGPPGTEVTIYFPAAPDETQDDS